MENKYSNKYLIETGIGLQDVDGLKNSPYFLSQADRYINGEISLEELNRLIDSYYKDKSDIDERTEEADKVSNRIAEVISDDSFVFSTGQLISIHKRLFEDVFSHAGKLRDYNFIKREWVLDGRSVIYGDYHDIQSTLEYNFDVERKFQYIGLSIGEVIDHLSTFVSNLWQVHPFSEGNTRTVAVFFIKYLRSLGFDVTNDTFAKNAWYFRNALVRANFKYIQKGICDDKSFIILFLRNLLLGENNELKNRNLHISAKNENKKGPIKSASIVGLMENDPYIGVDEIAEKIGVSPRTIKYAIALLVKTRKIKRINGKRFGYWKVINEEVIVETKRLILRKMMQKDFDALKKVINADDSYTQKWIDWCLSSYDKYGFCHYAVIYKDTDEMIGSVGPSMQFIDEEWKPEIGYHIRSDYHKQGLAKEAAKAAIDHFFNHFCYDEIYSYMDLDNVASYKTAESLDLKYLHDYKGYKVYRITREEWMK